VIADAATSAELDHLAGRLIAIRAWEAGWQNGTQGTMALAREALDRLEPNDQIWRALALMALGTGHVLRGEASAATSALTEAIQLALAADVSYVALGARLWLASAHVAQGNLREASARYRQVLDQTSQPGGETLPISAGPLLGLGCWVDYEVNDLGKAQRHLEDGIRLAGAQLYPWVLVDGYGTLARIKLMSGGSDAAGDLLRRMDQHAQATEIPWAWMVPRVAASVARAYLAVGQVDRAAAWAERIDPASALDLGTIAEYQRTTLACLHLARGNAALALTELDQLAPVAGTQERWGRVIEIETLRAVALERLGQRASALGALGRALTLAEPAGYVRRFVDEGPTMQVLLTAALDRGIAPTYVARLLRAFAGPARSDGGETTEAIVTSILASRPVSPLIEPLSDRERDVLQLLVGGRSAPEIAEALVVAPSTVRTHLKSIYGKLDAHSREQAIARARKLKLV
jgi:LuxR family transcriptional regulator, maltose regulon positive regulatory protein